MKIHEQLVRTGDEIMSRVQETIIALTKDNPLVLFTLNEDKDPVRDGEVVTIDELMDLPYCHYYGDQHYYTMGTIQKVEGKDVTIIVQDDYAFVNSNFETINICNISFDQQIEILKLINKRV